MIALLATAPIRRKNLAQLRLGHELNDLDGIWILAVPGDEMKNGVPFEVSLPEHLCRAIERYLQTHRPRLLKGSDTDAVWVSKEGRPMAVHRVGQRIAQITKRYMGNEISPHRFRHAAATSIATHAPDLAPIIRPLLAHTTSRTAERYYNKASAIEASRRVANNIASLRTNLLET